MKHLILALLLLPISTPPAMAKNPDQAAVKEDPDELVCKTKSKVGTRFPSKTCRTRMEWDKIAEENRRAAAEMVAGALPRRWCDDPVENC